MFRFLAITLLLLAFGAQAHAQDKANVVATCGTPNSTYTAGQNAPLTQGTDGKACISGSFSASVTGFDPTSTGTPISVTTGGVTGSLPAGTVVVASNVGTTNNAYCKLGASATTSDQMIVPGGWFAFTVGGATQLTCITSTSTTTVNMVGGSGLPTGTSGPAGTSSAFSAAFPARGTAIGLSDGTNMQMWLTALALADGVNGNNTGAVASWLYNGSTYDRQRGTAADGAYVQSAPRTVTLVTLDVKTVTTGGTAVNALSAGHRNKGGWLQNPAGASVALCINEIGTATGTTSSGDTTCIAAGQSYNLAPSGAAVSVVSSDSSHPFSGMGFN